jgi:hypothetical protein
VTVVDETEEEELPPLPALYDHACNVYKTMEAEADLVVEDDSMHPEEHRLVWEGHLTKLFARLHLSVPYYTSVTRELKRMGCVKQLRRGGGNAPSQWLILTAPTEELFREAAGLTRTARKKNLTKFEILEQRINDLVKRVGKVESDNELIIDILHEKEQADA